MQFIKHLFTKHLVPVACFLALVVFATIYLVRANNGNGNGTITIIKQTVLEEVPEYYIGDPSTITLTKQRSSIGELSLSPQPDFNQGSFSDLIPGTYTLEEEPYFNWNFVSLECDNGYSSDEPSITFALGESENVTCTFINQLKRASITVVKVADQRSNDEFGFDLDFRLGEQIQEVASATITGNGSYTFENLLPTNPFEQPYTITEILPEGWEGPSPAITCTGQSNSNGSSVGISLTAGEHMTCYFNNTDSSIISGQKFHDLDANGSRDNDEPFLSGWLIKLFKRVQVDVDELGNPIEGYQQIAETLTDENGRYIFSGLGAGSYRLCEEMQDGFNQSAPTESNGSCDDINNEGFYGHDAEIIAEFPRDNFIGKDFGNYESATITVRKFNDLDADGILGIDDGEEGVPGWPICLSWQNSDCLDSVYDEYYGYDVSPQTDPDGEYVFENVHPGDSYSICEDSRNDWLRTYPNPDENDDGCYYFDVHSGDELSFDFYNFEGSIITGYKFDDLDGDSCWFTEGNNNGCDLGDGSPVEPGLADWPIALGKAGEPQIIDIGGELRQVTPIEIVAMTLTSGDGSFTLPVRDMIVDGEQDHYVVLEAKKSGFETTAPSPLAESFFDITYRIETSDIPSDLRGTELGENSFFDIFVYNLGERILHNQYGNPLWFGNQAVGGITVTPSDLPNLFNLGAIEIEGSGIDNVSSVTFVREVNITVGEGDGQSIITIPEGTVITPSIGDSFNFADMTAGDVNPNSLSGLGTGVVAEGALQWGIPGFGLNFNPAISLSVFVGIDLNGQTLDILRSMDADSGWTSDGIVPPATCLVTDGLCNFEATKASNYAVTQTTTTSTTSSGGGSSGSYLPGFGPKYLAQAPVVSSTPVTPQVSPTTPSPISIFVRNLAYSSRGEDVRELQKYLNNHGFSVALSGYGSKGQETDVFGPLTKAALIKFQEANAKNILMPYGLIQGTGVFGILTRQFINSHP